MAILSLSLRARSSSRVIMIWDVPYLLDSFRAQNAPLTRPQLDVLVKDLAGDDAEQAGRAMRTLVDAGDAAVAPLREWLAAVEAPDEAKVAQLAKDLGSE